jgi:type II secretory pathway pseudopilin PulG
MKRPKTNDRGGFTLAESLLAAVVLMIAISAITMPFAAGARSEEIDARLTLASGLAQETMEEVLSKALKDPEGGTVLGPDSGETNRALYDDVDDYKQVIEAERSIADAGGAVIASPQSAGLSRETYVTDAWLTGQDLSKPADFFRVTVIVKHGGIPLITLTRLVYKMPA